MPPVLKYLLTMTAILFMAVSQVFGIHRGWMCLCHGEPERVSVAHCDDGGCGCDGEEEDTGCAPEDGEGDIPEPRRHTALTDAVKSVPFHPLALKIPDFTPWEPPFLFLIVLSDDPRVARDTPHDVRRRAGPGEPGGPPGGAEPVRRAKCAMLVV